MLGVWHPPWVKGKSRLDSNDFDFIRAGVSNVVSYKRNVWFNLSCLLQTYSRLSIIEKLVVKPVFNWANVCSPNVLRTLRRTMIRFLIELLVRRTWFGQSKLYFVLKWLVMRCKLRPELAADAQQTA